jgi:general secretion pathway protein A
MYLDYWQLTAKPFERTADRATFYASESHQGALVKLRYALDNRNGLIVLSGPAGIGKTLLIHLIQQELSDAYRPFVHLVFPQLTPDEFLVYLADHLGAPQADPPRYTVDQSIRRLEYVLVENARQQHHAVVVIDEAQLLEDAGLLETVRLLLNFENAGQPLLSLVLVGQTGLLSALYRTPALEGRVAVRTLLRPFTIEETMGYVQHRMRAAGARFDIFLPEALEAAHYFSQGIPQQIDRLCDLALLVGYAEGLPHIREQQIATITEELIGALPE